RLREDVGELPLALGEAPHLEEVRGDAVDAVGVLEVGLVGELLADVEAEDEGGGDAAGEATHGEEGVDGVLGEVAPGDPEVALQHDGQRAEEAPPRLTTPVPAVKAMRRRRIAGSPTSSGVRPRTVGVRPRTVGVRG